MNLFFILLSQIVVFSPQPNIKLEVIGEVSDTPQWSFFAPHENENVANEYVSQQILERGGVFVILRQNGKRLLRLDVKPFEVKIDPNRIFTKKGRRNNIIKHNPNLRTNTYVFHRAMRLSADLAQFIVETMGGPNVSRTWVAMHNNTQGYLGDNHHGIGNISIVQYQQKLAKGAAFLKAVTALNGDEDDLFFVTQQQDFNAMEQSGWNAVLQHPQVVTDPSEDDGSLSVYAQKIGVRYINIEAERATGHVGENHLVEQQQMLDYVFSRLELGPTSTANPQK
ncbi:MAG: hypothetical protein ABJK37_02075 [Paraglaciecola sp.]|uniref:hypothetical protein n=1 Tax=Paraglaciecola sp. TaxID=1920173 RepID=UPI003297160F